jgi:hypothetical protein
LQKFLRREEEEMTAKREVVVPTSDGGEVIVRERVDCMELTKVGFQRKRFRDDDSIDRGEQSKKPS